MGKYGKGFGACVRWEVDVRNAGVVEEVRVWGCGDEDRGEVGQLGLVSREINEVQLGSVWSHCLSEPGKSWEQGWRCLALTVDAVEDEDEFLVSCL